LHKRVKVEINEKTWAVAGGWGPLNISANKRADSKSPEKCELPRMETEKTHTCSEGGRMAMSLTESHAPIRKGPKSHWKNVK